MAQPSSRKDLVDYCLRKLGYPVLEINVAEEQIDDLVDDALQLFQERHFDGVYQTYLKYQITQDDIDRGRAKAITGVGMAVTTASSNIAGIGTVNFNYFENSNYIQMPNHVIGVNKIFKFEGSNSIASGMFSIKYQLFLNDIYYWGSTELLTYAMVKTYLEDIDWSSLIPGQFLIIDCYRMLDPNDYSKVWNDSFIKPYLTSLVKRQWGQNLIKFQGMKLPGGVELNGRQIYDDAQKEIDEITSKMFSTYELPPLDMIG